MAAKACKIKARCHTGERRFEVKYREKGFSPLHIHCYWPWLISAHKVFRAIARHLCSVLAQNGLRARIMQDPGKCKTVGSDGNASRNIKRSLPGLFSPLTKRTKALGLSRRQCLDVSLLQIMPVILGVLKREETVKLLRV